MEEKTKKRKAFFGIALGVVAFILLLLVALQYKSFFKGDEWPKVVERYAFKLPVSVEFSRVDSPWISLRESEFTGSMTHFLGQEFVKFDRPGWWERVSADLAESKKDLESASIKSAVRKVPPGEWLKENARRGIQVDYIVRFFLPGGGILQRRVSKEDYREFLERYPRKSNPHPRNNPRHIIIPGSGEIFSKWNIFENVKTKGRYSVHLDDVRKSLDGQLLFEYENGNMYALVQLPKELLEINVADLERGFSRRYDVSAECYTVVPKLYGER